jgi:hypothetical protein
MYHAPRMNRRTFLDVAAAGALAPRLALAADKSRLDFDDLRGARGWVVPVDAKAPGLAELKLERDGGPRRWTPRLVNKGKKAVRVREVVVFSLPHQLPADTQLYGESFQMLTQTTGTIGKPQDLGYSEPKHYKIPGPEDATVVTGLLTLTPPGRPSTAASTCVLDRSTWWSTPRGWSWGRVRPGRSRRWPSPRAPRAQNYWPPWPGGSTRTIRP